MASFEKTVFKNGSAPYLSDTVLNALQDKINNALKGATDLVDLTSKIKTVKGNILGGHVLKMGRIAFWQIAYKSTEESSWAEMLTFPEELEPLTSYNDELYIQGMNVTVYGKSSSTPLQIRGPKNNGEGIFLTFYYITKN